MPTLHRLSRPLVLTASTGLAGAAVLWLGAAPAAADVPLGWSDPDPVDPLYALLVLGGVPVLLFVLITLAVYLPALARGERVAPGAAPIDDQWLGGPRESKQLTAPSGQSEPDETGGARGSW